MANQEILVATIAWYAKSKGYGAALINNDPEESYLFHINNYRFCKRSSNRDLIFSSRKPPIRSPREGDRIVFLKDKGSKKIRLWGFADQWEEQGAF